LGPVQTIIDQILADDEEAPPKQRHTAMRRVEVWRGGFRLGLSVSGPFGCRCLTSFAVLRFHTPLIKPGRQFSRTRLSDKAVFILRFTRSPTNDCRYVRWSRYSPSFWYRCST
jgi:hypothetical protein